MSPLRFLLVAFVIALTGCGAQTASLDGNASVGYDSEALKPTTDQRCGINSGRNTHEQCAANVCCSDAGWCGTTAAYCQGSRVNAPYDGANTGSSSGANGNAITASPNSILAGYFPTWITTLPRLVDVPTKYNMILLFAATPVGGAPGTTGAVQWDGYASTTVQNNLVADIATCRARGQKIILSIGGAGAQVNLNTRARSQAFVDSIRTIATKLGGIDGIDLDTYEGQTVDVTEYTFVGTTLKTAAYFGPNFLVTTPPAPWNNDDMALSKSLVAAGALDFSMPQYYDGPGLADPNYIMSNVATWSTAIGASHLVVLFGIQPGAANYTTSSVAISTYKAIKAATPTIRGAGLWQIGNDQAQGYTFVNGITP